MKRKIKLILGIFLLLCIFLPLGSCQERKVVAEGNSIQQSVEQVAPKPTQYLIPILEVEFSRPDTWIFFLSFIWPIPLLAIRKKYCIQGIREKIGIILEILLAAISTYIIYSYVFKLWYKPMIWGYWATILMVVYTIVCLSEIRSLSWKQEA